MAINVSYLYQPSDVETGTPQPIAIEIENDTANDITISGISVVDSAGVFTGGAFIPCFPVAENIYSVGASELNPIPAWGTAEQSSERTDGNPLIYFPANLSGVAYVPAVEGINYASGSYGGQSYDIPAASDPLVSTSVVIPAGETCYYATQIISLQQGSLYAALPGEVEVYGDVEVLVLVEGEDPLSTGFTQPYLYTGTSVGLSVVPVGLKGSSNVLVGSGTDIINLVQYGRNPQYANFDFPLRVLLDIDDGRQIDVTRFSTFTSSDTMLSVVAGASAYGTEATSVVGSSPRITAGGGACSINYNEPPENFEPLYSDLVATCPSQGLSASTRVGVLSTLGLPVQFRVTQTTPIVARYAAGQANLSCSPVIIYEDGTVEDETGGSYVLMEFDAATNQGDGITGGILQWDDQDYGTFYVNASQTVDTNTFIKVTWIDALYPILMGLSPIYVPVLVKAN